MGCYEYLEGEFNFAKRTLEHKRASEELWATLDEIGKLYDFTRGTGVCGALNWPNGTAVCGGVWRRASNFCRPANS